MSLAGAALGWRRADAALRAQLDLALTAEAESLLRDYEAHGAAGLAASAANYARRGAPVAVLLQAGGQPVAGAVPGAPPVLRGFATLPAAGSAPARRALGAALPGGLNLVVAAGLEPVERAAAALAWTPLAASLAASVAALCVGFLSARAVERRLARVSKAARALVLGGPAGRLPVSGRDDEFDRLVEVFNAALERIEALIAVQRQVTDDIAHDLRSPLSRLRQRLEAALARARDPAADEAVLAAAAAELDTVLATFTALLRIARAESGALAAGFAEVDLSALVAGVAEAYAPVVEEAGRAFRQAVAPGVRLRGDATLLRQALANLLDNALHHGAGAVAVALEPGPVLSVADAGPGVPEAEREAVLRRFHRLDASRATPGSGLGLALVAAAAAAHGGRVSLLPAWPDGSGLRAVLDLRSASGRG